MQGGVLRNVKSTFRFVLDVCVDARSVPKFWLVNMIVDRQQLQCVANQRFQATDSQVIIQRLDYEAAENAVGSIGELASTADPFAHLK